MMMRRDINPCDVKGIPLLMQGFLKTKKYLNKNLKIWGSKIPLPPLGELENQFQGSHVSALFINGMLRFSFHYSFDPVDNYSIHTRCPGISSYFTSKNSTKKIYPSMEFPMITLSFDRF